MSAFVLRAVLMRSDLPLAAKAVGVVILDHQGRKDGVCKLSVPKLADACGVSPRQAKRATRDLRDAGWLATVATSPNRAHRRLVDPTAGCQERTPVPKQEGVTSGPLGCHQRTPRVSPADPTEERISERISETTLPPTPQGAGKRVEARREEWRSAISVGFKKRLEATGEIGTLTDHASLLTVVLACCEWEITQPRPLDHKPAVAGMLDRFFAAKTSYRRPRIAWLAEDVGQYLDPTPEDRRSRMPDGKRRKTWRQPPCHLTATEIDNSHSESIFGDIELEPLKPLALRLAGGSRE